MTLAIARLYWKRLWRGKMIWISGLLFLVPIGLAVVSPASAGVNQRFSVVVDVALRSLVLLVPVLLLSTAVSEESEGKTYTYLWSRPVPRTSVLWGKLLVVAPLAAVACCAALVAVGFLTGGDPAWLPRVLGGAAAGIVAACAFSLGVGALVPRHPLVVTLGWVVSEQLLPMIPAVNNISILHHVQTIADLPAPVVAAGDDPAGALLAMAILSGIWLAFAVWRVRAMEFGSAEG